MIHQAGAGSWTRRYAYAAASNRLLSTSLPGDPVDGPYTAVYTHDVHGNMTSMPHLSALTWDEHDQLRTTDLGGGGIVYYVYDAAGQRVRKVWEHSGLVEERIYLGGWEVYRKRDASGLLLERETLHVMDDARRVAMVETKTVDTSGPFTVTPRTSYQLDNHLGSACLEVDEAGLVIGYEEYHPYGTTAYWSGRVGVEVSARRYRYTGKEKDEETGLYYHGVRYYASWLGRWTASDPKGIGADTLNLYEYVRGNPIALMDPNGTQSFSSFANPAEKRQADAFIKGELPASVSFESDPLKVASVRQSTKAAEHITSQRSEDREIDQGQFHDLDATAAGVGPAVKIVTEVAEDLAESGIRLIPAGAPAAAEGATLTTGGALGTGATLPAWLPAAGIVVLLGGAWFIAEIANSDGRGALKTPPPGGSPPPAPGANAAVPPPPDKKRKHNKALPLRATRFKYANVSPDDNPSRVKVMELKREGDKWVVITPGGQKGTPKGLYTFVTIDSKVYVGYASTGPGRAGHIDLSLGVPVDYAGEVRFSKNGVLEYWDNNSGHYMPLAGDALQANLPINNFKALDAPTRLVPNAGQKPLSPIRIPVDPVPKL